MISYSHNTPSLLFIASNINPPVPPTSISLIIICFPVVTQAFKVEVEVLPAARGCTAVLRCVVPSFVKDLVRVVSWVQEPTFYIYPSLQGGKPHYTTALIMNFPLASTWMHTGSEGIVLRINTSVVGEIVYWRNWTAEVAYSLGK